MVYFKNLDFLKFVFIIMVVLSHIITPWGYLYNLYPEFWNNEHQNYFYCNCTMAFFVISSFLLVVKHENSQITILEYLKKRYLQFFPYLLTSLILGVFLYFSNLIHYSELYDSLYMLLLIDRNGLFKHVGYNGVMWFFCLLFWLSCGLLAFIRNIPRQYLKIIIWLITLIALTVLSDIPLKTHVMLFMIALSGIGVGYIIGTMYNDGIITTKQDNNKNTKTYIIYSALEFWAFLYFILCCLVFPPRSIYYAYLILFLTIILFIMKRGFLSEWLDNNLSGFLGKYSFSIAVCHIFILYNFQTVWYKYTGFFKSHMYATEICLTFVCIIFSIILYHIFIIPFLAYLKKVTQK